MTETNFKHTDLGLIPHDWEVKTLEDVVDVYDGTHQTPKYVSKGVNFYSVENVTNDEFVQTKYISEEEHQYLTRKHHIEKGDVLMTRIGSIGKCKYIDWDVRASYYVSLALLKKKSRVLFSMPYLAYASESDVFKESVKQNSLQFAIPLKINLGEISKVLFFVPPTIAEQERIAGALASIDTLIGALTEQIEKKRHIKQGTMQQLLTGKKRLAGFTGEWKSVKFQDLHKYASEGGTPTTSIPEYYKRGKIPFAKIEDTTRKYITSTNSYITELGLNNCSAWIVPKDNIIFTNGATIGNVAINKIPLSTKQGILGVVIKREEYDVEFLYYLLSYSDFQNEVHAREAKGTFATIILRTLNSIKLLLPPTIAEQSAIAAVLSGMDTEIAALEQKHDKYIAIKSGMMQNLLTGKIRLV